MTNQYLKIWFKLIFIIHSIDDRHYYIFNWLLIFRLRMRLDLTLQKLFIIHWSLVVGFFWFLVVYNWIKHFKNPERMYSSLKELTFNFNYRNTDSINFTTSIKLGFSSGMLVHCIISTAVEFIWIGEFARIIQDQVGDSGLNCN